MRCRSKWIESHITSRCSPDSAHTVAVQSHTAHQTIGNRPWLFLSLAFSRIGNNVLRPAYRWAGWWFGVLFHEERQLPWKPKVREPYTNSTYLRRPPSRSTAVPPYSQTSLSARRTTIMSPNVDREGPEGRREGHKKK